MIQLQERAAYGAQVLGYLTAADFVRATFAGAMRFEKAPMQRVTIRAVALREGRRLQVSRQDGRKDISTNHTTADLPTALADVLGAGFANVHITMQGEEIDLRLTKKGEVLVGRRPGGREAERMAEPAAHNRVKEVPLPEGKADRVLEAMGILDRNHRVRPAMRDKFTQINEFLKLLEHVLPEVEGARAMGREQEEEKEDENEKEKEKEKEKERGKGKEKEKEKERGKGKEKEKEKERGKGKWREQGRALAGRPLVILDCGCGSSHLTLATAHFLNDIKGISARVVGIDANAEVIEKSRARAAGLGCRLEFRTARIGDVRDVRADIVLALHACDTATDDALVQAVRSGAKLILAVPCCHRELNGRLHMPGLTAIHRHGILHQRLADMVTDTMRGLLLEVMGYRAEIIEFISAEHTARNLMIRAVRVGGAGAGGKAGGAGAGGKAGGAGGKAGGAGGKAGGAGGAGGKAGGAGAVERYVQFRAAAGVRPYLEGALGELLPAAAGRGSV